MQPDNILPLPFLTRKMLNFEHGVVFDLEFISVSNVSTKVELIGITREGLFKFGITHTGNGSEESVIFKIPDIPIFVTAHVPTGVVNAGRHYARVYLRANGERIQRLMSGYITSQNSLNWPDAQSGPEITGDGNLKTVVSVDPPAGTEASISVPANEVWHVHALNISLVTDATVANRKVGLIYNPNGGGTSVEVFGTLAQGASLTTLWNFLPGVSELTAITKGTIQVRLPQPLILDEGASIETYTENLQAGDNFGSLTVMVLGYLQP